MVGFFPEKTRYLKFFHHLELFPRSHDSSIYRENPLYIYFGVLILSLTGKIILTSLIDYFSKQQLSIVIAGIFRSQNNNTV